MDDIDRKLLEALQEDASLQVADLAERIGRSVTPTWKRLKRLEEAGIITGRVAVLDREALGIPLTVFVSVKTNMHNTEWLKAFEAAASKIEEIVEVYRMSGEMDYLMKIVCPDIGTYDAVYRRLIKLVDFSDVSSHFAMEIIKSTNRLPLKYA